MSAAATAPLLSWLPVWTRLCFLMFWGSSLLFSHDFWTLLFTSGPLHLHLGCFKEGTLENIKFRVNPWLFISGCLALLLDLGTDQHPACAALRLGVWFFLQGSWSKDFKGRGRTKMPKTSAGCCCICTLIFCSGWALPLTRKRLEILPLIMGQK